MSTSPLRRPQRGASFVELIIFILVVSIGVVGLLGPMNLLGANSSDPLRRKQALMIAEGLMEEVMLARFTYCDGADAKVEEATNEGECDSMPEAFGREVGNDTRPYDNINDYVESAGVEYPSFNSGDGVLADVNGTAFDGNFTGTLKVSEVALNGVGGGAVLKITVAITDTRTEMVTTLDAFRLRYAPNSPP